MTESVATAIDIETACMTKPKSFNGARIARNSLFGALRFVLVIPITFLITPYTLHKLGMEQFGIWALLGVLTAYAQFAELGMTTSLVKFIAEYESQGKHAERNGVISTAMVLYVSLGAIAVVVIVVVLGWVITRIFRVPIEMREQAHAIYMAGTLVFVANLVLSIFDSSLKGLQRMDITNIISLIGSVVRALGTFAFLEAGLGLWGLVVNDAFLVVITAGLSYFFLARELPDLKLSPLLFRPRFVRQLVSFGINVQIMSIAGLFISQINKVLLSYYVSVGAVSFFEIGTRLTSRVRAFIQAAIFPLMPAASQLEASSNKESINRLYYLSLRYAVLLASPVFFLMAALAVPFSNLWLGSGYGEAGVTMAILALAYLVTSMTFPGSQTIAGMGLPQYITYAVIFNAIVNTTLSVLLTPRIGYFGVVVGGASGEVLHTALFLYLYHRVTKTSLMHVVREVLPKPLLANSVLALAAFGITSALAHVGYLELAVTCAIYLALYAVFLLKSDCLEPGDMRTIKRLLPTRIVALLVMI